LSSEVGYSGNRPAMLCFHNSARILTALIDIQVSKYHKTKQLNLLTTYPTSLVNNTDWKFLLTVSRNVENLLKQEKIKTVGQQPVVGQAMCD